MLSIPLASRTAYFWWTCRRASERVGDAFIGALVVGGTVIAVIVGGGSACRRRCHGRFVRYSRL